MRRYEDTKEMLISNYLKEVRVSFYSLLKNLFNLTRKRAPVDDEKVTETLAKMKR